ncbi:hypothetical protein [Bradyrhizobium sp. WSM2254]|uniref:hypothetical protein n=1 Tax=Bradyrhizobium sp. WSM2254 TaxID=1188263 RepID=UPI001FD9009F|nr:hypothetical protein [Bradyrhizobium sp. WSM2254]
MLKTRGSEEEKLTIVEATNYFAKQGQAPVVLQQRRQASGIRRGLGLEPGEILVLREGNGPDVRWECRFATRAAYEADMAARAGSEAFSQARQMMHTLVERFERHVYEVDDSR